MFVCLEPVLVLVGIAFLFQSAFAQGKQSLLSLLTRTTKLSAAPDLFIQACRPAIGSPLFYSGFGFTER